MNWITFHIISDLVFGELFGCPNNEEYHPWINVIPDGIVGLAAAIELNGYGLVKIIEPFVPKSMQKGRQDMVEYTTSLTKKGLELGETTKPDFVTLMSGGNKKGDMAMTEGERFGNAEALIVAGSNTVAILLSSAIYLMMTHPEKTRRVTAEVRKPFKTDSENEMNFPLSLAEVETRLTFAKFLWHFDLELCPNQADWLQSRKAYFTWEEKELFVKVKERQMTQ
ncbi:hypothetical protein OHC33_001436 [Knufia fluminis]|uniref:Cytochrome P450 n=1 Tax=Knufia fluminis TaxID=191047 RepID=A0AAN8IRE1_9EURO|nr:hypothetical protein OHC33_001436 [Knufia fluminis]